MSRTQFAMELESQLTSAPGDATAYVDLMLVSRHLERILRHAVCVADQAADAAPAEQAGSSEVLS